MFLFDKGVFTSKYGAIAWFFALFPSVNLGFSFFFEGQSEVK